MSKRRAIILDTSAFIAGFDPFIVEDDLYSVPAVGGELAEGSLPKIRFDAAAQSGKLKMREPSFDHVNIVKESSKEIGDVLFLSEADMKILALGSQLKEGGWAPTIVTDDYSIQNVARKIGVNYVPLMTFGIRYYVHWLLYCPACRRNYPSDYRFGRCEVCGTDLKRKPLAKTLIEKESGNQRQKGE